MIIFQPQSAACLHQRGALLIGVPGSAAESLAAVPDGTAVRPMVRRACGVPTTSGGVRCPIFWWARPRVRAR